MIGEGLVCVLLDDEGVDPDQVVEYVDRRLLEEPVHDDCLLCTLKQPT